jgi:F0F1-type ATP synthase membrane subunit c/vacuolar-type H+-ATPase subunit K
VQKRSWQLLGAGVVLLRLAFILFYRIDSDEPQHLHVVWGWSRGLVPYRDVFDNHLPLLHLLFAPLMRVVPESSSVFLIMRLAIAPFALGAAYFVYKLAARVLDEERAVAAALIFCVLPPWLPKSVEFRNDTLWIFFWLASLVCVTALRKPRYFAAGIAGGLCLLASAKALPLLLAHAAVMIAIRRRPRADALLRFVIGAAIPIAFVLLFLHARGGLDAMLYATRDFNTAFPVPLARRLVRGALFLIVAPLLVLYGCADDSIKRQLTLFALWYSFIIFAFWPIISPRDYLPLAPLLAIAIASTTFARRAPAVTLAAAALAAIWYVHLWQPAGRERQQFVDGVAALTTESDYVFDLKGDSIFRRRPLYVVYEHIARTLIGNGTIADRGPEALVAHGCCVAITDSSHIPARTRAFLNEHFLDLGSLRVCGTVLREGDTFTIAVPQTYAVIGSDVSHVLIDGTPYRGPRFLAVGAHTIARPAREPLTVVWSHAVSGKLDSAMWSRIIGAPRAQLEASWLDAY